MNIEIEIKVGISDYKSVRKILLKKCKLIKKVKQIDTYYTPFHRDYYSEKPIINWIRTRKAGKRFTFEFIKDAYKKNKFIKAQEYEIEITDKRTLVKILELMELKKSMTLVKTREYYLSKTKDFEICLDTVKDLGNFLEIETKRKKLRFKDCYNFLKYLDIKWFDVNEESYVILMQNKLKNKR